MLVQRSPLTARTSTLNGPALFPNLQDSLLDYVVPAIYGRSGPTFSSYSNSGSGLRVANVGRRSDAVGVSTGYRGANARAAIASWRGGWRGDPVHGMCLGDDQVDHVASATLAGGPFCIVPDSRRAGSAPDGTDADQPPMPNDSLGLKGTMDVWFYQLAPSQSSGMWANPVPWSFGTTEFFTGFIPTDYNGFNDAFTSIFIPTNDPGNDNDFGGIFSLSLLADRAATYNNGSGHIVSISAFSGGCPGLSNLPYYTGRTKINEWNHLAITWDIVPDAGGTNYGLIYGQSGPSYWGSESSCKLYVNGKPMTSIVPEFKSGGQPTSGPLAALVGTPLNVGDYRWGTWESTKNETNQHSASEEYIFGGKTQSGQNSFGGWLSCMGRWGRQLGDQEIRQLYEWPQAAAYSTRALFHPSLLATTPGDYHFTGQLSGPLHGTLAGHRVVGSVNQSRIRAILDRQKGMKQ